MRGVVMHCWSPTSHLAVWWVPGTQVPPGVLRVQHWPPVASMYVCSVQMVRTRHAPTTRHSHPNQL
jgi:hypothetical protein